MFAVIEDSGAQIKVSEGDVIQIDTRDLPADAGSITSDPVLFLSGGGDAKVGTPLLDGATVTADIVEEGRTDRVEIYKLKRRKTYKRHKSHRQSFIKVKVTAINA